jgi:hypothetical protein
MMTLKEINEKVNKASWETPACKLEQLKADILNKMHDSRLSYRNYCTLSINYDRIHRLTFKEPKNPDYIIKNVFGEKVGSIKIAGNLTKDKLVSLWLYHQFIGNMYFEEAEEKIKELCLFIEEVDS